jgi:hypothetical protein
VAQLASDPNITNYQGGKDYGLNQELGQITYIGDDGDGNHPLLDQTTLSGSLTLTNTLTEPFKFPALFGGIEDDDGDLSLPIQSLYSNSEIASVSTENELIQTGTGLIRTVTTPSFEAGTGMVASTTTFTITGTSPSPALSIGDLIRIKSGANADLTHYRKVTNVAGLTVTVTGPALTGGSFSYEATVSNTVATGTIAVSPASFSSTLHTTVALAAAKVGQTIVITSGPLTNTRTQITSVSGTTITVGPSLSAAPAAGTTFRVDNPLSTYGGIGFDHYLVTLQEALNITANAYTDQQSALFNAVGSSFNLVTFGSTSMLASTTFIDLSADFSSATTGDYVYIPIGPNFGLYAIQSVDSPTQLTLATPLPSIDPGPSFYAVETLFGLSLDSVTLLLSMTQSIQVLLDAVTAFSALLGDIPVYSTLLSSTTVCPTLAASSTEFATGLITTELNARAADVVSRLADIASSEQQISDILANTDKLYDKRYVWIDTRINLESGLLVGQTRAIANRIKAQADILKQLTKLLAVEGT